MPMRIPASEDRRGAGHGAGASRAGADLPDRRHRAQRLALRAGPDPQAEPDELAAIPGPAWMILPTDQADTLLARRARQAPCGDTARRRRTMAAVAPRPLTAPNQPLASDDDRTLDTRSSRSLVRQRDENLERDDVGDLLDRRRQFHPASVSSVCRRRGRTTLSLPRKCTRPAISFAPRSTVNTVWTAGPLLLAHSCPDPRHWASSTF